MHIPIRLGLLGGNGHDIALKLDNGEAPADGVVSLTKRRQSFRFVDVPSRPVPSLLRGFSAPVNVTLDLPDDDAELLMASDSDLFNRWQAANSYAARTLVEAVAQSRRPAKNRTGPCAMRAPSARRCRATASSRPTVPSCSSCRPKPTSPASSARTSTRRSCIAPTAD